MCQTVLGGLSDGNIVRQNDPTPWSVSHRDALVGRVTLLDLDTGGVDCEGIDSIGIGSGCS